jgi:uncharacterized protein (DUF169 family)
MGDYAVLAERLENSLGLKTPPVAVTFGDRLPDGIATPDGPVAAGCSFWELGAKQALATNASHHQHCSIGIHTHNLSGAPASQSSELEATLAAMQGLDYVRPDEVAGLPVMQSSSECVVYSPLKDVTDDAPAVVILFADAAQGLIISEGLARVDGAIPMAMGRPACAFIPQILNSSRSAASLGCCGARAYLGALTDGITLWGLFGAKLESYVSEIETLAKANGILTQFHELRRADFSSGATPSVAQSLERLA